MFPASVYVAVYSLHFLSVISCSDDELFSLSPSVSQCVFAVLLLWQLSWNEDAFLMWLWAFLHLL